MGAILRGKYRLDRVLGVGGMAVVYGATHRNQKQFAVKMIHPELTVRSDIRARFLREGYLANTVNHPGVVAVLDDDVDDDGSAFVVMELLEGVNVETLGMRFGPRLPLFASLDIMDQLLDVLDAAHAKAVIHRDIKPANIFLRRDGQVKVLDFGIARLRDATAGLPSTRTGAMLGTPAFMAPEQALAEGGDVDPRTDLWAAGATLFTMISGHCVHEGNNARQVLIRAATAPARSLATVVPDAPVAVVEVVDRALQFDRAARWESASAMREALARVRRDLLGARTPGQLVSLFEGVELKGEPARTGTAHGSAPSVASVAVFRDTELVQASFVSTYADLATSTVNPVSTRSGAAVRKSEGWSRRPRTAAIVLAGVVGAGAVGGLVASARRGVIADTRSGVSAGDPVRTAGPPAEARGPSAGGANVSSAANAPSAANAANAANAAVVSPARVGPVAARAGASSAGPSAPQASSRSAAVKPRTAVGVPPPAPSSPATAPRNPLLIELQ